MNSSAETGISQFKIQITAFDLIQMISYSENNFVDLTFQPIIRKVKSIILLKAQIQTFFSCKQNIINQISTSLSDTIRDNQILGF